MLIDVEADAKVQSAQELCDEIKKVQPDQHVAFVCNYRVAIESDCPDEIIRAEFNPEALVRGVQDALGKRKRRRRGRTLARDPYSHLHSAHPVLCIRARL